MPEFDKDLQPVLLRKEESLPDLPNPSTPYPDDNGPVPRFGSLDAGVRPGRKKSALENFFGSGPIVSEMLPTVSVKELSANQRYSNYSPFIVDSESTHAETQSGWDKAANGILKFAGIAGTTVLGLGGLVYGSGKSVFTQKLSDIWDNEITNTLDEINTSLDQKYLPNYYSRQETNARWYSPDNWMTWNFLFDKVVKNGGYVAGAILSGNIVSGVVKVAGASIGARLLSAATAAEASQAFKIFTPLLRNSARAMSLGANAEVEAAMIKDISSIADVTKRASELNNIIKTTSSFAKFNDQGRRVITAAFANAGEASFEALHTGKAFREKLINEYKEANDGIEPDEKALKEIDAKVAKVGKASFLGNLAILGITEYFQLPRLMGSSYAADRAAANSLIRSTSDIAMKDAKYVVKTPTTRFGKFLKTADKLTAIRRYVADPKEGVQEILQYGLDVGVQNYFEKAFKTGDADIWSDGFLYGLFGRDEMGKGEGALVSKEGIEGGVIGALTGGVMSAGRTYSERKALESNTNNFIKALNSVPSFKQAFQDRLNSANRGLYLMAERDGAVLLNDKLEAMDINADMMYNYLSTRIKYGRYDMVMEDLAEFRQLGSTEEGLASLKEQGYANLNDTIESYSLRLSGMEQQAKTINDLYESMGTTYGGQILTDKDGKPILDAKGNQQLKYTPQILDRMVYAATKIADYDNRIPKLNEALSRLLTSDITSYSKNNATVQDIVNEELTNPESDILETTINNIKSSGELLQDDAIQTLVDIVELSQRRKKFLSEYNEILENPQNVRINGKEVGEMGDEISDEDRGKTIQIKTRAGVRDYEIGEEYFLGQVVKYDKDGNEVILFPRLTLLGENEDGTIKIRDNKGVRNVSKEEFEGYKLGKVSAVRDNENASFYLRNVNNVVYWNTGKAKSGKIAGRLTYDYVNDTLYFTYKDKKGKVKSVEVSLDSFTAKEGFTEGVFSFGRTLSAEDQADINKRKETGKTQEDINRRKAVRLAFINNLYNSLVEKLGKTQNLIQQKYSEFEKITNELTALENKITGGELTRKSNFKRTTARAISAANRLSRMREQLLSEIRDLETQQEEIETTVSYLEELSTSLDELPTDSRDFLEELRQQVRDLESLTLETGQNINSISKIITSTEKALEYALNLVRDLISKFESTYPKVPTIMGQDWVDFLKANPNFLKLNPNFKEDLAMVEDIIAQVEDLDIVPNERTVAELREQMEKLQEQLSELDKELRAKSSILSVFEDAVKQYEQQKAEEETLLRTREIMTEVLGTKDNGPQTTEYSKTYEPESKKETSILPRATVASTGKPHHERANRFGINLGKFREAVRNKIRGVYITANNEDQLIPGLIDHLRTNSEGVIDPSIPRDKVIALVMVAQEEDGSLTLVDVNGEPLAANADKINSAIYQVYPEEKLEWDAKWSKSGKAESMFRKDVPEEVQAAVRKQYAAWRKATLEKTTLDPHEIAASFGIPSNVKKLDDQGNEKTDYDASTSVADAGLVTDEQLERDRHIEIAKNNDTVSEGTVSFKTPLGRVFLRIPGIGLVKLKNRRLTKTEVNTIYEAIYRLSQNMVDPKKGIKSDESKMLVSWLKSVIYWGTPRQPGYNSVWFDFDETTQRWMLNMSGKGKDFPFTPSSIKQNKAQIIEMLSLMYNNVNSTLATGKDYWNKPYYEIIGFDSDGKPITRTVNGKPYWPNYQTFLLSKQGRKPEELPLSTIMRPLKNEDDYNREGVYFYTTDNADEFPTSAPKPTVAAAPPAGPTVTPTVVAPGKPEVTATFDLSGEVTNSIDIIGKDGKNYGTVTFEVNGKELLETGGDKGLNNIKVTEGTVKALAEARGISIDDAKRIIPQYIVAKLGPQLQALQNEMNKKEEPTPAPVQPTAPTPVVTAPTPAAPVAKEEVIEVKPTALISTKYNREDFPDYQPNTRTPATQKLLDYFAEVMGVPKYTEDLSKGEYPAWIESVGKSEGAEMLTSYIVGSLNNLKKAFDAIAEYEKERAVLEEEEKALEAKSTEVTVTPKVKTEAAITPVSAPVVTPTVDIAAEKKKLEQERDRRIEQEAPIKTLDYPLIPDTRNFWNNDSGKRVSNQEGSEHLDTLEYNALQLARAGVQPLYNGIQSKETLENVRKLPRTDRDGNEVVDSEEIPEGGQKEHIFSFFITTHVGIPDPSLVALLTSKQIEVLGRGKIHFAEEQDFRKPGIESYTNKELKESNAVQEKLSPDDWRERPEMGYVAAIRWAQMKLAGETNRSLKEYLLDTQKEIRDEYQAKIDALERKSGRPTAAPTTPSTDPSTVGLTAEEDELMRQQGNKQITDDEEEALREIVKQEIEKFQPENWKEVEDFLRKNFPNIPVYRVKNIIQATNGRQAWGMLKNGAIYIYENAEVGTAYHEIFEAVWKHFSDPNEQRSILNEFKSRKGSFVDRVTGQEIKYKDATYQEAKEQLAEEFRDYVRNGTVPPKPGAGRPFILKLFYDIKNFIEEFFTGKKAKSNTEKLFEKIGSGYYKNYSPYHSTLAYAKKGVMDINDAYADGDSEFSLIGITGKQRHEIIEHMTYVMLTDMIKSDESLFKINEKLTRKEVYDKLKAEVQTIFSKKRATLENDILEGKYTAEQARPAINRQISLWKNVTSQWDQLVKMHEDYLKIYSIEFDENDEVTMKSDERSKESGWHDANKIDTFRKANNAVKMFLATVFVTKVNEQGKTVPVKSSIGGRVLLPISKVYISLMNNIHDAVSVEDMLNKIRKMAETDPNYRFVYKTLAKSDWSTPGLNLSKIEKEHGLQLISAFWKTFKKQNPEVKNVFVLDNGDVVVGDANLSSAARQVQSEFEEAIIGRIREGKTKYFKLSEDRKKYIGVPEQASKIKIGTIPERVEFLKGIGIDFDANDILRLSPNQIKTFKDATDGIARSIKEAEEIFTASGKILKLKGRLLELGVIKSAIENPEFESTFFNLNGERVQSFIGTNAATELFEFLSQLPEFTPEALQGTKFEYLLTDSFAKGSTILERMFKESQRVKGSEGLLKPGYVDGFVNEQNGKRKESSKLNYRERLIQELNLNLAGYYLNLVPGDASMEHMMYMGNVISANDLRYGYDLIYDVFGGYFKSELELSREDRPIQKIKISEKQKKQGVQQRNSTDLRFFKTILGKELHDKIVKDKEPNIDKVYEKYKSQIDKAIKDYVSKQTSSFKKVLNDYNILKESEEGIIADGINLEDASLGMDEVFLDRNLEALTVNYMISNIEMHKLLYADPYQYSDELKRIKNFLSPRQALISNSPEMNAALNTVWNKGYKPGDVGYTDMTKDEFVSVAINDIEGVIDIPNYDGFEETDGSGIMNYKAYRNFRIRSSDWNDNEELQYRYDVAYEKADKGIALNDDEKQFLGKDGKIDPAKNPGIRSAYTARKPIVAGNKNDGNLYNDPVLDKFAIYPLSYRVMKTLNPESNAVKLYNKMQAEGIDYVVFKSGRKVGATQTNDLYNEDGSFNTTPFKGQTNIPFSIISVQSEVPSKEDEIATRGSQVTKLVTMDFMESGVPIDFKDAKGKTDFSAKRYKEWMVLSQEEKQERSPLYKELMNNQKLLEALIDEGYNNLLKSMGIEEVNGEFKLVDKSKAGETLRREVLKREVNDNTIDALEGFLRGDVVLEATPAYQQIRNILYSIADREVVSQKISGGMKVQIPSTLLESVRAKKTTINGKTGYTSDVLKFYEDEDGKRVCEIMVGRWFDSSLSDEELIAYLNKPENQEILRGMAFRIPTQKQNSIDVFKIKQFLPREFGDNVVIPAALVKKVGSDFDIDKLTVYLKNVYENVNGELKAVPFFGYTRVEAKAKFDEMFDSGEFLNKKKLAELDRIIEEEKDNLREIEMDSASGKLISSIFKSAFSEEEITKDFINYIVKSTKQEVRDKIFDKLYKKSLENAYIKSGENLVSSRENFDKLIAPNSAKQLQDLAAKITEKLGLDQFDYSSTGNMLNRHFMSRLRHAFVTGKYAIGIAAVNQTSHSLNQRQPIYVDFSRLSNLSKQDVYWLTKGTGEAKDAEIKFKNYNRIEIDGKMVPTLSMIKNAAGQYISDINGQFIDGYVDISRGPWIMELGATPNVAGTWLFLVKLGVPIDTVAYFMNQPIIRDYLRSLENAGYSYVFNDTFVNLIKEDGKYALDEADSEARLAEMNEIPSEKALLENIGKKSFNNDEKAQQHFILGEFLKYAKMAEQAFYVTQGSNFDTATFNDPYLVFRKSMQFKKAQNTIISSVDEILENSFLGKLAERIFDFRNAYSTILRSDTPNVRNVMEKVLLPYVDMNDRDFVKVAQKAVADLFDWAVQNDRGFNKLVQEVLLEKTGVAGRMFDFVRSVKENPEHPLYNNHIINILEPVFSKKIEGGVNNLKIKGRDNKVYDQNNIIFAFRELKESIDEEMYKGLMNLAVLQSGIANSPISFTSLLPYEDFKELYNETLSKLETLPNLEGFYNLNVFERNNWNNDDIVPYMVAKFGKSKKEKWYYNLPMNTLPKNIKAAISNGEIPQMLNISAMSREATKDVIVYRWETKLSKSDKKKMREKGDYSYINKGLFKKVYDESGNPYIYESASDGKVYRNYVYKMINAWGDSFRANEFYDTIEVSKIDNGFIKVQEGEIDVRIGDNTFKRNTAGETADAVILDYYINADKKNIKSVPLVPVSEASTAAPVSGKIEFDKLPGKSVTPTMTYAGIGSRQTPPEILAQMTEVARELSATYTLNTGVTFGGKKEGADKAFDDGATKKNLFSPENQGSRSREQAIAKEIHPNPGALSQGGLRLMARNTNQVFGDNLNTPVDFVLFYAEEVPGSIRPKGGTGQAVEMARRKGIPTINMANPNWRQELDRVLSGSTQPTAAPVSQEVKGNITLNIIEDWVQSGQATTTVRNSSYHNSFYKGDGVYTTDKGNRVNITYRGLVKIQGDKIVGNNISYTKDEFAKAEGFGTWENFKKGAKYAGKTLMDGGSVHLYDIKPAQAPAADEASLRSQIAALEEKMRKTGLGPAESGQLTKLQNELGKLIKSSC